MFYDQEPIYPSYNQKLFSYIHHNFTGPIILITTEKNSDAVDEITKWYNWPVVYYFHHVFAAHDWYRGVRFDSRLIAPTDRQLSHKFISFNRITSKMRVYRSLMIAELQKLKILNQGYVSYNHVCHEGGTYQQNLVEAYQSNLITKEYASDAIKYLNQINYPLRIDFQQNEFIPNHSFLLSAVPETQRSFCYMVTETCFWEQKCHLTEKIFKPIVSRMPFVLVGPAHNLKYLKSYGFKTFSDWFDESYDDIEDPVNRIQAIGKTMSEICQYDLNQLQQMLTDMAPVLEHNYNLFYSDQFLQYAWQELTQGLETAVNFVSSQY